MKPLLITIALLFSTPAWAEGVEGKSFFCMPLKKYNQPYAIYFAKERVKLFSFNIGRKRTYLADGWFEYSVGDAHVYFAKYYISRKNLSLYLDDHSETQIHQCEFMEFSRAKEQVVESFEKARSKAKKGNQF